MDETIAAMVCSCSASSSGGHLVSVFKIGSSLSKRVLQEIARFARTTVSVFISSFTASAVHVSTFSPDGELAVCAAATIATFGYLYKTGAVGVGTIYQHDSFGTHSIIVTPKYVTAGIPPPKYGLSVSLSALALNELRSISPKYLLS